MKSRFLTLLFLTFAISVVGCPSFRAALGNVAKDIHNRFNAKPRTARYQVLVQSDGGANGAWGARFFNGSGQKMSGLTGHGETWSTGGTQFASGSIAGKGHHANS